MMAAQQQVTQLQNALAIATDDTESESDLSVLTPEMIQ
jgi:hypothetical protein